MKLNHKSTSTAVLLTFAFACAAGFGVPSQASVWQPAADPVRSAPLQRWSPTQRGEVSRDQAAAIVKRRFGGKILAVSEVQKNGRSMYRVKGLSEKSQVYVVYVDKQSGRIVR
ncbi:PepSY domain-containing protein [Microbulbifer aggregans]|uniref:PepSY domain-containing protein n=1 Tax=Microbulbifer aggregans TaxID=1769779 RepID=UPI001314D9C7|nr:PepSY domain-containing protein [Microbulbifer aggregans]